MSLIPLVIEGVACLVLAGLVADWLLSNSRLALAAHRLLHWRSLRQMEALVILTRTVGSVVSYQAIGLHMAGSRQGLPLVWQKVAQYDALAAVSQLAVDLNVDVHSLGLAYRSSATPGRQWVFRAGGSPPQCAWTLSVIAHMLVPAIWAWLSWRYTWQMPVVPLVVGALLAAREVAIPINQMVQARR